MLKPLKQIRETDQADPTGHLRDQIIRAYHLGRLGAGDRLPSIRQVAADHGWDHRAVAAAYRRLESEGWVVIRGRGGVFAAGQPSCLHDGLDPASRSVAWLLTQACQQRVPFSSMFRILEAAQPRTIRCAFVESVSDLLDGICGELRESWGFDVVPVTVASGNGGSAHQAERALLTDLLREVDFAVTTSFHANSVGAAARALDKPVVVLSTDPQWNRELQASIRDQGIVVVCVDALFGERIRILFSEVISRNDQVRIVTCDDAVALRRLGAGDRVLLTRAARDRLGAVSFPTIAQVPLAPDSISALVEAWARVGAERVAARD